MLKLRAINFNYRVRVSEQNLRRGFHDPRLARPGRSQEQHISDWAARRTHASAKHLIQIRYRPNPVFLAHNPTAKRAFEFLRFVAMAAWIELGLFLSHRSPNRSADAGTKLNARHGDMYGNRDAKRGRQTADS